MGQLYTMDTGIVSGVTTLFELEIIAGSANSLVLHSFCVSQTSDFGDTEAEGLKVELKRAAGAYTTGGNNASVTPIKMTTVNAGSANATAQRNTSSAAAAGSGTLQVLHTAGWNIQSDYQYYVAPEHRPEIGGTDAFIISVEAPNDALDLNVVAIVEEVG